MLSLVVKHALARKSCSKKTHVYFVTISLGAYFPYVTQLSNIFRQQAQNVNNKIEQRKGQINLKGKNGVAKIEHLNWSGKI